MKAKRTISILAAMANALGSVLCTTSLLATAARGQRMPNGFLSNFFNTVWPDWLATPEAALVGGLILIAGIGLTPLVAISKRLSDA